MEREVGLEGYANDQELVGKLRASVKKSRFSAEAAVTVTKYAAAAGLGWAASVAFRWVW